MKFKLLILTLWTTVAPVALIGLLSVCLISYTKLKTVTINSIPEDRLVHPVNALGQSRPTVKGMQMDVKGEDARPLIIAEFLEKHQSPLQPYDYWGVYLTNLADKYDMDFRLLPAISMQESNLCKKIPQGSFNCLGLGIHARGTWTFERFEDNFEAAAKVLKSNYLDKGYITPDEIQDKYTPGSNGSWEFAVNHFMEVLEYADF